MTTIDFIGLGVMGSPMCRNVAMKHDGKILSHGGMAIDPTRISRA